MYIKVQASLIFGQYLWTKSLIGYSVIVDIDIDL